MHAIDLTSAEMEGSEEWTVRRRSREYPRQLLEASLRKSEIHGIDPSLSCNPPSFVRRYKDRDSQSSNIYTALCSQNPHDHSKSLKQPPNHITTIGIRYVVSALNSDIFGLLSSPLFTGIVWLLLVPVLVVLVP